LVEGREPALDEFAAYEQTGALENMLDERPEDAEVWHALARTREMGALKARAGEAYAKALELFLRERRLDKAAEVWESMRDCGEVPDFPADLRFQLACALDEHGHKREGFLIFRDLSQAGSMGPQTEASLMRAAEAARLLPDFKDQAVAYYQRLLDSFPYSTWRDLVLDRLRELGAPGEPVAAIPVGRSPAAPADGGAADPGGETATFSDPYNMGAVGATQSTDDL
jgi:pentatricopeptide repeat protein